MKRNTNIRI